MKPPVTSTTVRDILLRIAVVGLGLWIAGEIVPGVTIVGLPTLIMAAAVLGFLNAIVKPILVLLSLPFILVTLGLFLFVLNAATFALAAWLFEGFRVAGFGSALLGSIVVSIASWAVAILIRDDRRRTQS
ncbi:MAG: phage holin family protein [Gammaproteobacteria bacterium]|nr:phage holin family protein [Gammaproteobacteria bacterium]